MKTDNNPKKQHQKPGLPSHHQRLLHDIVDSQENLKVSKTVDASPAELSVLWSDNTDTETVGQIAASET